MKRKDRPRIGFGYDVHQLVEGREMWIGGIQIPSEIGILGHSDADVLLHAICDSILGALSLGDIGVHFSDKDPQFKGIDSKKLLRRVIEMVTERGFEVGNIDGAIILEAPKIAKFVPEMCKTIANICNVDPDDVSIKATTSEKLGFVGNKQGIEAMATTLLFPIQ